MAGKIAAGVAVAMLAVGCTASGEEESLVGAADGDLAGHLEGNPVWEAIHQDQIAQEAEQFERDHGRPPPDDADFVRFIDASEYGAVHAECMREQGFDAEETADGGVDYTGVPPDQHLAFDEARFRCLVAYPPHPRIFEPATEEEIRALYDYRVDELRPCLTAEGYQVGEPPSFETFLADYEAEDRHPWNPYADFDPPAQAEWDELVTACPQIPPTGTG